MANIHQISIALHINKRVHFRFHFSFLISLMLISSWTKWQLAVLNKCVSTFFGSATLLANDWKQLNKDDESIFIVAKIHGLVQKIDVEAALNTLVVLTLLRQENLWASNELAYLVMLEHFDEPNLAVKIRRKWRCASCNPVPSHSHYHWIQMRQAVLVPIILKSLRHNGTFIFRAFKIFES